MKIIVLGTGFVAQGYLRALHYLGFHPLVLSRSWLNYCDPNELKFVMRSYKPDVLINCAGYTGETIDDCEKNSKECILANAILPCSIACRCKEINIPMIHVSSGCIFNGPGPFTETDKPNFTKNLYNFCKEVAEDQIRRWPVKCWMFRIRMPFSHVPHPRNWLCKLAKYDKILDGLNSVTWLDEFCMRSWMTWQKSEPGIYHCVQPEPVQTLAVANLLKNNPASVYDPEQFLKDHVQRSAAVLSPEKFEAAYGTKGTKAMSAILWCREQLYPSSSLNNGVGLRSRNSEQAA